MLRYFVSGIRQLLSIKTSRRFFSSRLTPDMENKLNFLTSRVRFGQQKRYQDWFQRQVSWPPPKLLLSADSICNCDEAFGCMTCQNKGKCALNKKFCGKNQNQSDSTVKSATQRNQ